MAKAWRLALCKLALTIFFNVVVGAHSSCEGYQDFEHLQTNAARNQPYKTAYHFQSPKNWLNDPNGPMYYRGIYHLFYQYNPSGPLFGDIMIWAHSISYDLINWVAIEPALCPSQPFDIKSCWSGSATLVPVCPSHLLDATGCQSGGSPLILYTGIDSSGRQVQNLAEPANLSDPFLRRWTKSSRNPIMIPPQDVGPTDFRDPSTAWRGEDGSWKVVIGGLVNGTIGAGLLYQTNDFVNWKQNREPLYWSSATGMWECPDFFPVSLNGTNGVDTSVSYPNSEVKHVLQAGFHLHDYYVLGKYDSRTDTFIPESHYTGTISDLRLDYGKFYASKSFFDNANNRRVLWGWVNESDSSEDDVAKGWSGLQVVPRKLWLDRKGNRLMQWPIEEIKGLRDTQVSMHNRKLSGGEMVEIVGINAAQADAEIFFNLSGLEDAEVMDPRWKDPQRMCTEQTPLKPTSGGAGVGPFGLLVLASKDLTEATAIYFRIFRSNDGFKVLMCSDQSRSSVRNGLDKDTYGAFVEIDPLEVSIALRCLIDHSIVESFGGEGKSVITARVYPELAVGEDARMFAFNNGTKSVTISSLNVWSMKQAHINSNHVIE